MLSPPSAVGLANNHSRDYGPEPMFRTMDLLKEHGYQVFGAGKNIDEAYKPVIFEKGGTRVAIFAVCENEFGVADYELAGTAGYSLGRVKRDQKCKSRQLAPRYIFPRRKRAQPLPLPGKDRNVPQFCRYGSGGFGQLHYMNTVDAFRNEWLDDFKKNHTRDLTRIKNVFCCEAHNELMRNSFDVIYNDKMDEAASGIDYIRNLQQLKYRSLGKP